ncbi:MAG: hypothetical protein FJZ00_01290 [Candidatus Sericytochromatia bacterium]|uniref:Uncharacterized protein n=1 Tax=Candidatus Tanganyikabacteria bacterium TaxID=2961651 RepID=A0A937X2T0_9BACT|nr:hypothetical protein [Candidatus Tanganyikabacteria bacterium]
MCGRRHRSRACLREFTRRSGPEPVGELIPGVHFYVENGRWVFTAAYHLDRGYCCGSGCRHCPYFPRHVEGNTAPAGNRAQDSPDTPR